MIEGEFCLLAASKPSAGLTRCSQKVSSYWELLQILSLSLDCRQE
jgi:hypothetical protein